MYIGIINNSDVDRCDVILKCTKIEAAEELWKQYNEIYEELKDENELEDSEEKYKKADFLDDAEEFGGSACIQCRGYHINFEIHEVKVEVESWDIPE